MRFKKKKPETEMCWPQSFGLGIRAGDLQKSASNQFTAETLEDTYQQYVYGILKRVKTPGAHMRLSASRPRTLSRNRFMISPKPCQVIISTKAYEMKFVIFTSAFDDWILASGCGNDCVGDHGILNRNQQLSINQATNPHNTRT